MNIEELQHLFGGICLIVGFGILLVVAWWVIIPFLIIFGLWLMGKKTNPSKTHAGQRPSDQ